MTNLKDWMFQQFQILNPKGLELEPENLSERSFPTPYTLLLYSLVFAHLAMHIFKAKNLKLCTVKN